MSGGYGKSESHQRASADVRGARHGGSLSRELDLELVRLEILVDSLEEMEEQLMLNEDECDNVSEYHSSEDGDLSSARET
nr:hypothetical protein BaRGS_031156 [Batillaria attramentaria]